MSVDYELNFLQALAFTVAIETIVLIVLIKTAFNKEKQPLYQLILAGIVASTATLPYVWFILPAFIHARILYIICAETWALIAETFIINGILRIKLLQSLAISFICNLISFSIGLLIF